MPEPQQREQIGDFVERLAQLAPGDRARLKRDAGKTMAESHSIGLAYRILPYGLGARREEIYFLLATVYPLADGGGAGNLGDALRLARDPKPDKNKGLDRRVEILLDADVTQLPFRLRQTVRLLKSRRVKVNWEMLLADLLAWERPDRPIQKRWARQYFGRPESADASGR
jgi:CRISPR system Cascade subunit CasB